MSFAAISPVAIVAKAASISEIGRVWNNLISLSTGHAADTIKLVNLGREIGLGLQTACGHEQMRLSFYENIKAELPESLTFEAVQKCIALAKSHPGRITTLEEASQYEQSMLLATGLLSEAHRSGPQASHDSTPDTCIWKALATAKDSVARRFEDIDSWDKDMRSSIKEQLGNHKIWLEEMEARL